jgi:hypothetical protein
MFDVNVFFKSRTTHPASDLNFAAKGAKNKEHGSAQIVADETVFKANGLKTINKPKCSLILPAIYASMALAEVAAVERALQT